MLRRRTRSATRRTAALLTVGLLAAAALAACSSSGTNGDATTGAGSPHSTVSNPGPNLTGSTDPGPHTTSGGPQTISGVLAVADARCARLTPASGARTYQLALPAGLAVSAEGLADHGRLVARPRDQVFVAGHTTATAGTCGTVVFQVSQIVSVQPAS